MQLCQSKFVYIVVDTIAPEITFVNELETYDKGIYLHGICSEDTAEVWLNDEYMYLSDVPDFGIYLELTPGVHNMELKLYDRCGLEPMDLPIRIDGEEYGTYDKLFLTLENGFFVQFTFADRESENLYKYLTELCDQ